MQFRMRSSSLGLIALAALAIAPAWGDTVTYDTTGTFSTNNTAIYSGANGLTITYGDTVGNKVSPVPPPTNAQFGTFTAAGPTTGTDNVPATTGFTLVITQHQPSAGTETLTDTFTGTISISNSSVSLLFTGGSSATLTTLHGSNVYEFDLGNITYYVDQYTAINPSTSGCPEACGVSTIGGVITSSNVPDGGTTLTLLGGALVGIEALRRKLRV